MEETVRIVLLIFLPGTQYMLKNLSFSSKDLLMFVLDEADEMLSRGFEDQIYEIFQYIPRSCQTVLMSATMPPEALKMTEKFMENPIKILVQNEELTLEGIKQYFVAVEKETYKFDTLCDIYTHLTVDQAIIYTNTKRKAEWLAERLRGSDFSVIFFHCPLCNVALEMGFTSVF